MYQTIIDILSQISFIAEWILLILPYLVTLIFTTVGQKKTFKVNLFNLNRIKIVSILSVKHHTNRCLFVFLNLNFNVKRILVSFPIFDIKSKSLKLHRFRNCQVHKMYLQIFAQQIKMIKIIFYLNCILQESSIIYINNISLKF